MTNVGKVLDMGYHRNGSSGEGFWTIIFEGAKDSDVEGEVFVATYFSPDDGEEEKRMAVLRVKELAYGNAQDCIRGDNFHYELKKLVDNYEWPHEKRERLEKKSDRRAAIEHTRAKE